MTLGESVDESNDSQPEPNAKPEVEIDISGQIILHDIPIPLPPEPSLF